MNTVASNARRDFLLLAGKVIAIAVQAVMAIGALALCGAVVTALFYRDRFMSGYAEQMGDPGAVFPLFTLVGVMLIGVAIAAALFVFFGKLRQIIATVGEGDPFQPANARRLNAMGWLMLGVQALILPADILSTRLARIADELKDVDMDGGMDFELTGVLIIVLLFILARVFKHGAAMRDDLEGTV